MLIVNHDGGQKVLSEFSKAGVLCQINLTLGRQMSLKDVVKKIDGIDEELRSKVLKDFSDENRFFFRDNEGNKGIVQGLSVVSIVQDEKDEVAVITFDSRGGVDLYTDQ